MKRIIFAAIVAATLMTAEPAAADRAGCSKGLETSFSHHYFAVKHQLGARAPGRNIRKLGYRYLWKSTHSDRRAWKVRDARCHELRTSLRQLKRLRAPLRYSSLNRTAVGPSQQPAGTLTPGVRAGGTLTSIAACESGGNPRAVSANGTYRGKYQFDRQTWRGVGGTGDPAAASEAEQDMRAAKLLASRGTQPWPECG